MIRSPAAVLYNPDGSNFTLPVDTYSVISVTSATSGSSLIVTPTTGSYLRLHYVALNADGGNAADVTSAVCFSATGSLIYKMSLKPGSIFARNVGAGRRYLEGAVDESLYLNLSTTQTVNVTIEYDETT
jgi:hypothetical protein